MVFVLGSLEVTSLLRVSGGAERLTERGPTAHALPVMVSAVRSTFANFLKWSILIPIVVLAAWTILADNFEGCPFVTGQRAEKLL